MRTVLQSAAAEGVEGVVVISSVYSYGRPRSQRVAEDHPREPATRKGEFRKQQEDAAIEADRAGRVHAMVVHLPDFYGPFADLSLANPMFDAALKAKRATWLGSPDLPHEFLFVPDLGPPIVELVLRGDCWGERWNLAGAGAIPAREFIRMIYQEAGREPRFQKVGRTVLRVAGIFSPFMREVAEMFYLYETPVILDDSRLRARLGDVHKTSYADGAARTMAWLKAERVQGDPRGPGSPPYLRSPESRA